MKRTDTERALVAEAELRVGGAFIDAIVTDICPVLSLAAACRPMYFEVVREMLDGRLHGPGLPFRELRLDLRKLLALVRADCPV